MNAESEPEMTTVQVTPDDSSDVVMLRNPTPDALLAPNNRLADGAVVKHGRGRPKGSRNRYKRTLEPPSDHDLAEGEVQPRRGRGRPNGSRSNRCTTLRPFDLELLSPWRRWQPPGPGVIEKAAILGNKPRERPPKQRAALPLSEEDTAPHRRPGLSLQLGSREQATLALGTIPIAPVDAARYMTANLCVKCAPLFNAAPCYLFVTCDACRQQCRAKGALTLHTHYAGSSAQPAWSVPQYHLITALPHQQSHPLSKPPTPAPRVPGPPVPPRIPPPTPVVLLPLVEADSPADPPKAIAYQSLRLLLIDLNRLLCTPHEEQPFDFRGTCSIVADPAVDHATRVTSVAWALIRGTAVSFNVHTLAVHCSPRAALAVTGSSAIWMGAPPDPRLANATQPRPCERCEHLLHIHVDADDSACARGLQGQRIVVRLWHYPT